jgi:hypothetical protein
MFFNPGFSECIQLKRDLRLITKRSKDKRLIAKTGGVKESDRLVPQLLTLLGFDKPL